MKNCLCAMFGFLMSFVLFTSLVQGEVTYLPQSNEAKAEGFNREGRLNAARGNFDEARKYFLKAIESDSSFAPAYNNLGIFYRLQGKYDESLRFFDAAEKIYIYSGSYDELAVASVYNNKGILFKDKGDYYQALKYYSNALNIFLAHPNGAKSAAQVYNNIGNVYLIQNEFSLALDMFLKSIDIKKDFEPEDLSVAYSNCAMAYAGLNEFELAEEFTLKSIENKVKYFGDKNYKLGESYINLAQLYILTGDDTTGLFYLNKAIDLYNEVLGSNSPFLAGAYITAGNFYFDVKDYRKALENFQLMIVSLVDNFSDTNIFSNPEKEDLFPQVELLNALIFKAETLYELYLLEKDTNWLVESLHVHDLLLYLIERMRGGYLDEESKLYITQNARTNYNRALVLSAEAYEITGSLEYRDLSFTLAEKSKAALLSSAITDLENRKIHGIPPKLQIIEKDILAETNFYEKKLFDENQKNQPDSSKIVRWQGKVLELSQKYDSLMSEIQSRYPDYYKLKYDTKIASIEEIQGILPSNQGLIEFSITDSLLFCMVITHRDFQMFKHRIDSTFYDNLNFVVDQLRNNSFGNISYEDFKDLSKGLSDLYTILVKDTESLIRDKKLLIIPDNQLGYLPFETLLTSEYLEDEFDFRMLPYLLKDHPVSYSYSATMYIQQKDVEKSRNLSILAFAPTYDNVGNIDTLKFVASRDYLDYLVPLRFVREEIAGIQDIAEGKAYFDFDASELKFWNEADEYDILHFAMHTLINDENPMFSQLVFTLSNDTLEESDGLLNTYEIYNSDLKARLAVLSACNTGYGKLQRGEGIMSLARGFFYAGVPSIVMTLWAVEDRSGSELMKRFYRHLTKGEDIDVAMQRAKLDYLQSADVLTSHPYLWSGYVNIGYNNALYKENKALLYTAVALGLAIILFLVFLTARKFRKRVK